MEIDREAPVLASAEIRIAAPIDLVWAVQADLASWPRWNPEVREIEVLGPIAPGTAFRWKAGGLRIASRLEEVEPPHRLGWTGRALGLRAAHVWRFTEEDGGTHVRTEESFDGLLARLLRGVLGRSLEATLQRAVTTLRAESERRAERARRVERERHAESERRAEGGGD